LGLDPSGIQWLLGVIEELSKERNITVFLSSHQLQEVQRVCSRVGIMSHGQLVLEGTVAELTSEREPGGYHVSVEVQGATNDMDGTLAEIPGVRTVTRVGRSVTIESDRDVRSEAAAAVLNSGGQLLEMRAQNRTLEEIYLKYFQEEIT
jgi:ABC-2 type transport system ATP-binding protein